VNSISLAPRHLGSCIQQSPANHEQVGKRGHHLEAVPTHSIERVAFRFHRMLLEFVWDASVLEGNPFTFTEVKTLLDGVAVGGRKISDQAQVLNLAESSKHLLALVKAGKFSLDKATFTELHGLVARNEALEWGHFLFIGAGSDREMVNDMAKRRKEAFFGAATREYPMLDEGFVTWALKDKSVAIKPSLATAVEAFRMLDYQPEAFMKSLKVLNKVVKRGEPADVAFRSIVWVQREPL
jgi:hypothetical protein